MQTTMRPLPAASSRALGRQPFSSTKASSYRACTHVRQAHVRLAAPASRRQLPSHVALAGAGPVDLEDLDTAKEAIERGNQYAKEARWPDALAVYEKALTLPGTGLKRYRDKPRLISDGEKSAALFNIACCHSQMGNLQQGLVALSGCLELGYSDFAQLRADPDLEPLRKDPRFEQLLQRFEPKRSSGGFFGALFGGSK